MKEIIEKGEISRLRSDSGIGGISGEAHLLKHEGKKYFLRRCLNQERAERYLDLYKDLEKHGIFPKLLYFSENDLLFEYLEGKDCQLKSSLEVAYEVGRIFALISQIPINPKDQFDIDKKFLGDLKSLLKKGVISSETSDAIKEEYEKLREKINPTLVMDVSDCIPSNFRISNNKVYLVDIESIKCRGRGRSIAKAFLRWFKKEEERKKFIEGYSSVTSMDFLTEDYLKFSYLYFLVVNAKFKIDDKKDYEKNLKEIDLLLKGKLK